MREGQAQIRGRGTPENPPNRFERLRYVPLADPADLEDPAPETRFLRDPSRSIISYNNSPDISFNASVNPYRGCEHGCVYCYARPTHEYLGFSAGLDFETKILVKEDAPRLLREALASPRWTPQVVAMSGVTDPYQPVERRLGLTRRCLEVFLDFRNPVAVVTKNHLVARDVDLLRALARWRAAAVCLSLTTLDAGLRRILEPRASPPSRRLAAIEALARAGVPTGVLVAPVIPGLTDHELPSLVAAAARAGARFAGYVPLRLPHGVRPLFEDWLERHLPERKEKVLGRIRAVRGGRLNDPRFAHRMRGEGVFAEQMGATFTVACRKAGIEGRGPDLSVAAFRRSPVRQLSLFEGVV
ncbi:MAG: PA0069 family radical SAM protein [Nitrospinota bacterium]